MSTNGAPSRATGIGAGTRSIGAQTSMSFTAKETTSLIGEGMGVAGMRTPMRIAPKVVVVVVDRVPLSHFYSESISSIGAKLKSEGGVESSLPISDGGGGGSVEVI